MRSLRVEFFKLEVPDDVDVVKLLETTRRASLASRHIELTSGSWCRVQPDGGSFSINVRSHPKIERFHVMDLMKVRNSDDIPLRVPPDDEATPFDRDDEDGAGDNTAFCFIPSIRIVAAQRNYHGPTIATYARLVQYLARVNGHPNCRVEYQPLLSKGLEEELDNLGELKNIEVVIVPERASNTSLSGVAEDSLSIVPSATRVSISISTKGSAVNKTIEWLRGAMRRHRRESVEQRSLENIVVTGTDKDGLPFRESLEKFIVHKRYSFEPPWPQSNDWPRRLQCMKQAVVDFISSRT